MTYLPHKEIEGNRIGRAIKRVAGINSNCFYYF